jgi:large subunit ribosomal protein L18
MANTKVARRHKISKRIRGKVSGIAERPRLAIFRSNSEIYAQLIDDASSTTLLSYSTRSTGFPRNGNKVEQAKAVGTEIAKLALGKGIETVVFDRGGFLYHGRVKALAEGAREGGLKF